MFLRSATLLIPPAFCIASINVGQPLLEIPRLSPPSELISLLFSLVVKLYIPGLCT